MLFLVKESCWPKFHVVTGSADLSTAFYLANVGTNLRVQARSVGFDRQTS